MKWIKSKHFAKRLGKSIFNWYIKCFTQIKLANIKVYNNFLTINTLTWEELKSPNESVGKSVFSSSHFNQQGLWVEEVILSIFKILEYKRRIKYLRRDSGKVSERRKTSETIHGMSEASAGESLRILCKLLSE